MPATDPSCWTGDLDYRLPAELIAQRPAERREQARLMVVERGSETIRQAVFAEIPDYLGRDYVMVGNDSRVFPARLLGRKTSGGRVEVLILELPERGPAPALFGTSKGLRDGQRIVFDDGVEALVVGPAEGGRCRLDFGGPPPAAVVERIGQVPLPPYISRPDGPTEEDGERYQTVYARTGGSVAAPTAGLHFTRELLEDLRARGVDFHRLTLHVGPGTFAPVRGRLEDHRMEGEFCEISAPEATALNEARAAGKRLVAVGTTTVRALESAAGEDGVVRAFSGRTDLFIRGGHVFRAVDALITNFHLPGSTLLALVMAFAGEDLLRRAYDLAVAERYRFYSYGDAMLVL